MSRRPGIGYSDCQRINAPAGTRFELQFAVHRARRDERTASLRMQYFYRNDDQACLNPPRIYESNTNEARRTLTFSSKAL